MVKNQKVKYLKFFATIYSCYGFIVDVRHNTKMILFFTSELRTNDSMINHLLGTYNTILFTRNIYKIY